MMFRVSSSLIVAARLFHTGTSVMIQSLSGQTSDGCRHLGLVRPTVMSTRCAPQKGQGSSFAESTIQTAKSVNWSSADLSLREAADLKGLQAHFWATQLCERTLAIRLWRSSTDDPAGHEKPSIYRLSPCDTWAANLTSFSAMPANA
jgi:hypothetical protein